MIAAVERPALRRWMSNQDPSERIPNITCPINTASVARTEQKIDGHRKKPICSAHYLQHPVYRTGQVVIKQQLGVGIFIVVSANDLNLFCVQALLRNKQMLNGFIDG